MACPCKLAEGSIFASTHCAECSKYRDPGKATCQLAMDAAPLLIELIVGYFTGALPCAHPCNLAKDTESSYTSMAGCSMK